MKVLCTKIISPTIGEQVADSPWIQIGREYVVLAISAYPGRSPLLQILADDNSPSWWDSEMFGTTSTRIPSVWVATVSDDGGVNFEPDRWRERGFWERYFDRDGDAEAIFQEELAKILSEAE